MTTYNPAEVERLIAEANAELQRTLSDQLEASRASTAAMADQLEAARTEVTRLRSELDTATLARSLSESRSNNLGASHTARDATKLRIATRLGLSAYATQGEIAEAVDAVVAERDALRAVVEAVAGASADQSIGSVKVFTVGDGITTRWLPIAAAEALRLRTPRVARSCSTCGKPGCRPQEHAGWDPSEDMP